MIQLVTKVSVTQRCIQLYILSWRQPVFICMKNSYIILSEHMISHGLYPEVKYRKKDILN